MLIECAVCASMVDGKVLSECESMGDLGPYKYVFIKCPVCKNPMVGFSECFQTGPDEFEWTKAERVWPNPKRVINVSVPEIISSSLEQAEKCLSIREYDACAVMCGRAIEGICKDRVGKKNLSEGLKELKKQGFIDARLNEWAESLRSERNIGAHATDTVISEEDAKDLLDFAHAIIDYVYVLTVRHERYKKRKSVQEEKKQR